MSNWASPAALTGVWGAIASTAAAVIAWRVFAWQRRADEPMISCDLTAVRHEPDWLMLTIGVTNTTSIEWQLTELRFRPATAAKGTARWSGAFTETATGGSRFDANSARQNSSSPVRLMTEIGPVGSTTWQGRPADDIQEVIYFERSSIRVTRLSMRLSLASKEAVQRKITIAIKREVPPAITADRA